MSNYLYNSVELPPLPNLKTFENTEEDFLDFVANPDLIKAADFPYVCIMRDESGYVLSFGGSSPTIGEETISGEYVGRFFTSGYPGMAFKCEAGDEVWYLWHDYFDYPITFKLSITEARGYILWSNTDLESTDGTYSIKGTDPIPVSTFTPDPISLTLGWIVGRRIAGQRGKKVEEDKTPIAYLYNGVQLPDINEVWTDKETYPYAVMSNAAESVSIQNAIGLADQVYQLMVSSSPTAVKSSGSGYRYHVSDAVAKRYIVLVNSAELDALMTENNLTDEDLETALGVSRRGWLLMNEYDLYEAGFAIDSRPTNWANHDILNEDGSTYLAASDPVPVYE